MDQSRGFYGIIVTDNPKDDYPLWTFVSLYKDIESAMLAIDTQYYLEHQHATNITRSASGTLIWAEGPRGHCFEFKLVTLKCQPDFDTNMGKLYAVAKNGHVAVTGDAFFPSRGALIKNDVTWAEGTKLMNAGHATYDKDRDIIIARCQDGIISYQIKEFVLH